jgi:glycosyltransferase involved in cell wall biosynthesis
MVTNALPNGGAERQLALLAASLPRPWTASVLSLDDGPYRAVLERSGVDVRVIPRRYRFDVTPAIGMWRAASEARPDIVHTWDWMSTTAMVPFCRAHRIPLLNGSIRRGRRPARRTLLNVLSVALSDVVVANSRAGLAAYGITEDDRSRVVYNGFDFSRLAAPADPTSGAAAHDGMVAIMTARMAPDKDWRAFLGAARVLSEDAAAWRFVAVGGGAEREALMAEAADLVDAGVVEFPSGGLEVLPMVAASDIGILLTDPRNAAEGCSNSIMEYMACGLPVVCTDSGGNPELVQDGRTGLLVEPGDIEGLVSALRSLRDDPARARRMGSDGRLRLESRFTVAESVAGFIAAYESVLGDADTRASRQDPTE